MKTEQAISRTSAATYKVMEPQYNFDQSAHFDFHLVQNFLAGDTISLEI